MMAQVQILPCYGLFYMAVSYEFTDMHEKEPLFSQDRQQASKLADKVAVWLGTEANQQNHYCQTILGFYFLHGKHTSTRR